MTMYGMPESSRPLAILSRIWESIQDPGYTNLFFNPRERVGGRKRAHHPRVLKHRLHTRQVALKVNRLSGDLLRFPLFPKFGVFDQFGHSVLAIIEQ